MIYSNRIKTNLVTGGAGFIGSHLIDRLMQKGEKVICLDNFYTGRELNVSKWINNKNFTLENHDIVNPIKKKVDNIWHLACPASPVHYQADPIKTAKTNFLGTLNMLELAKENNAKILLASTSEIYGDPEVHPQSEDYKGSVNIIGPRSCYDEGKRISETLFYDFKRIYNTNIRVIRIFNTYGPRMLANDGRVISNFVVQALKNKPLTIYGDGSQTRSFCYIDDLIDGIEKVMNSDCHLPINLGNTKEFTILELAKLVKKKLENNLNIDIRPLPEDDPIRRKPNISRAKKELDWEPKISLNDGLDLTIKYFMKEIK